MVYLSISLLLSVLYFFYRVLVKQVFERYFITLSETCQLVLGSGIMGNGADIFIFDMWEPVKIIDLANKIK